MVSSLLMSASPMTPIIVRNFNIVSASVMQSILIGSQKGRRYDFTGTLSSMDLMVGNYRPIVERKSYGTISESCVSSN